MLYLFNTSLTSGLMSLLIDTHFCVFQTEKDSHIPWEERREEVKGGSYEGTAPPLSS